MSSHADLLRAQDWGRVSARILAYAIARTRSKARASDLAQEAMMRVLDARWHPWDPEKDPDIVTFLIKIVNRLLANENQKRKLHREIAMDRELNGEVVGNGDDAAGAVVRKAIGGGDDADPSKPRQSAIADRAPSPETRVGDRELYERRMTLLRSRLAKDTIALDVLEQTERGVDLPDEQAAATGHSLHDIHTARRRCAFNAEKVARDIPAISVSTGESPDGEDHDEA